MEGKTLTFFSCQHKQLASEREDLMARMETLQSNVRQLEAQALELHKLKSGLERDLEAERLLKEQKTKVQWQKLGLFFEALKNTAILTCLTSLSVHTPHILLKCTKINVLMKQICIFFGEVTNKLNQKHL